MNIPETVTTIGSSAFYNCTELTSINIHNSVTKIGSYAFQFCEAITAITIPESIITTHSITAPH